MSLQPLRVNGSKDPRARGVRVGRRARAQAYEHYLPLRRDLGDLYEAVRPPRAPLAPPLRPPCAPLAPPLRPPCGPLAPTLRTPDPPSRPPRQVLWARAHDARARAMADALVARGAEALSREMVLQYVHMLLRRYARLLAYRVERAPGAQPVAPGSPCLATLQPCTQ